MAAHPKLDIYVAYCSLQGAEQGLDEDFGRQVKWDVPLLDGYSWTVVRNRSPRPALGRFWGLVNTGLWSMIRKGNYDAILIYTGYRYVSFWIALLAAKLAGVPIFFGTDASSIQPRQGAWWKLPIKSFIVSRIYRLGDGLWSTSLAGREYLKSLRVPEERIEVIPLVVDNDWWRARAAEADREAIRKDWEVPEDSPVVLFCAKLQPWKRPMDILRAFAQADVPDAHLVFAGTGSLAKPLQVEAEQFGIADRVHFIGFQNQSQLPAVYRSADLFVLPSEYDPCPAVVCEAMLCGLPVLLSDQIRGRFELIQPGQTGFTFPCGNVAALADLLRELLIERNRLASMGIAARQQMENFSPERNVRDHLALIERTVGPLGTRKSPAV